MTIDETIEFFNGLECHTPQAEDARNMAVDTMRKYKVLKANNKLLSTKLTNSGMVDFLTKQFDISRTSAKEMLHVMMSVKREDNFKKQFCNRK